MVEKKTQVKPKQVKPTQKKPNNKNVKAVDEAKVQTTIAKAKTQATKTVAKEKTSKKDAKPELQPKLKEPQIQKPKKNTTKKTTPKAEPEIKTAPVVEEPKAEPQVTYVTKDDNDTYVVTKKDFKDLPATGATHDGELPKYPEDPDPEEIEKVYSHEEIEGIFLGALNTTKDKVKDCKKIYRTLGLDSLDMLEVAYGVEKELPIVFTKDDAKDLTRGSFDAGVKLIESYYNIGR